MRGIDAIRDGDRHEHGGKDENDRELILSWKVVLSFFAVHHGDGMKAGRRLVSDRIAVCGDPVTIEVDGRVVPAISGESVAAAMVASEMVAFGADPNGAPLGIGCGMGACFACQVEVEGSGRARACITPVRNGMRLRTGHAAQGGVLSPIAGAARNCDVAIVGAGPAGLSAARVLTDAGVSVIVLDERPSPGGQYFKPLAASHTFRGPPSDRQYAAGVTLTDTVRGSGACVLDGASVWDAAREADGTVRLSVVRSGASEEIRARTVLLATGAIERPWIVPGWTSGGAMATGAAQTLARAYRVAPGKRIVVCGNGPLNLQVAAELVAGGAHVAALVEAAGPAWHSPVAVAGMALRRPDLVRDGLRYLARLHQGGVRLLYRHVLVRIEGDATTQAAIVARIGTDGMPAPGSEISIQADCVTMGYGFQPADELARLLGVPRGDPASEEGGRTRVPGVFVAGDCTRPRGAMLAMVDGEIAATAILRFLGRPADLEIPIRRRSREKAFQHVLWQAFAAKLPRPGALADDTTVICRCEGVRLASITPFLSLDSIAAIKRATRCGMGPCQGRYCLPVVASLHRDRSTDGMLPVVQPPLRPVAAAALTGLPDVVPDTVPEVPLTTGDPSSASPSQVMACDTLVVGGGAVGLFAARALALAGIDVVLVESQSNTGTGASGANAGSLHVQSLAYAYEDFESPAAALSFRMLPLQRDAVSLWQMLAHENNAEFEISVNGGLCLANSQADLARLRDKADRERAVGIEVHLLDAKETRDMLPGAGESIVGASFSPDEGKLNPLLALPELARLAKAAGARIVSASPVDSIVREGNGFRIRARGTAMRASRVILTAGPGTGRLANMLGYPLEIKATPLQMIVTERVEWPLDMLISHVTQRLTMKQAAAGNLIVGGGWRAGVDAEGRIRVTPRGLGANLRAAIEALPTLGAVQVLRTWTAVNALPIAGPLVGALPGVPGCFIAVSLNGLTLSPVLGAILADLARGRAPAWDIAPFDPGRAGTAG